MKGDFSRDTFDPKNKFTRVLLQQGRVQLDADWNEQISILLHQLRVMAADLIGPHGVPKGTPNGFKVNLEDGNLKIGKGRIYVDGLLCENHAEVTYNSQPDCSDVPELPDDPYLVYLDVWERHLTHYETDVPIREVALNGADTASRARLVWQVKVLTKYDGFERFDEGDDKNKIKRPLIVKKDIEVPSIPKDDATQDDAPQENEESALEEFCSNWPEDMREKENLRGLMAASYTETPGKEACTIPPDAAYRGVENQLYRVEIHDGYDDEKSDIAGTFKFSRENGSVIFPLAQKVNGDVVTLTHLGRDGRLSLKKGDWVEIVDDDTVVSAANPNPLYQVLEVNGMKNTVKLSNTPQAGTNLEKHPILRRWDQQDSDHLELNNCGVAEIKIRESEDGKKLFSEMPLEKGIKVKFQVSDIAKLRTGDYWLIPARVATGQIEWPTDADGALYLPPKGVKHYYAPLAIIDGENDHSCRKLFDPLWKVQQNQLQQIAAVKNEIASHDHEGFVSSGEIEEAIAQHIQDYNHPKEENEGE